MDWQTLGLCAFVFLIFGGVGVLLFDLWLARSGRKTITEFCRAHPWAAWVVLVVIQVCVMGLAVHFMTRP